MYLIRFGFIFLSPNPHLLKMEKTDLNFYLQRYLRLALKRCKGDIERQTINDLFIIKYTESPLLLQCSFFLVKDYLLNTF